MDFAAAAGAVGAAAPSTIDLHGLSVLEARKLVLATLRRSTPRAVLRFVSGLGLHSKGGVSAIKTDLSRCFDAWKLRWRWEHGIFVVVVSDTPAIIGRESWHGGDGSRPQVAVVSKAELAPWSTSSTRAWTHGSGDADLAAPGSFPPLGEPNPPQAQAKPNSSTTQQPKQLTFREQQELDALTSRTHSQSQGPDQALASSSAYDELVAQYKQHRWQKQQGDTVRGTATAGVGLVRQLSDDCRLAIAAADAERAAADAQRTVDTAELDRVREEAVHELISMGYILALFLLSSTCAPY